MVPLCVQYVLQVEARSVDENEIRKGQRGRRDVVFLNLKVKRTTIHPTLIKRQLACKHSDMRLEREGRTPAVVGSVLRATNSTYCLMDLDGWFDDINTACGCSFKGVHSFHKMLQRQPQSARKFSGASSTKCLASCVRFANLVQAFSCFHLLCPKVTMYFLFLSAIILFVVVSANEGGLRTHGSVFGEHDSARPPLMMAQLQSERCHCKCGGDASSDPHVISKVVSKDNGGALHACRAMSELKAMAEGEYEIILLPECCETHQTTE